MTVWAGYSGIRQDSRALTSRPSSASELPTSAKSLPHVAVIAWTAFSSPVSWTSATSLRPLMPPAALHHEVNTLATFGKSGILVKPMSLSTPTVIWLEVTPWSVAPAALPPWQTLFRLPKSPAAAVGVVDLAGAGVLLELLEPLREHPAASMAMAATAAMVLICGLTGSSKPRVLLSMTEN